MLDPNAIAEQAHALGIENCFGIPGSGNSLKIIDALEKKGIPFHLSHFEGSAALMAATTGRMADRPGLSISIKGPGVANAIPGIATAWFEDFPLVHLSEATPLSAPSWVAHKRMPQSQVMAPVTKGAGRILSEAAHLGVAGRLSVDEFPGPVCLEIGEDVCPTLQESIFSVAMDPAAVDQVEKIIKASQRPVVLASAWARRNHWRKELQKLNIPVFTTVASKGLVDETMAHSAGIYTGVDDELTTEKIVFSQADLVIAIGVTAKEFLKVDGFHCPSVYIGDFIRAGHEGFQFEYHLDGSSGKSVCELLQEKSWGLETLNQVKEGLNEVLLQGFLPGIVFDVLYRRFNGDAHLVMDTGWFCTIGEYAWRSKGTEHCLLAAQGRYMGSGLPMAIGVSMSDKSIPTLCTLGDGGIGMYISDVKLAVRQKLPLLIVLMSDGGFGCIRAGARSQGVSLAPLDTSTESWVSVLDSLGVPGTRVEKEQDLIRFMDAWNPDSGPAFMEVGFNPDDYEAMTRGIRG